VLSEQIEHHVHEEEKLAEGIFSQAQAAGIDMDELGDRLMARKEAILREYKKSGIPAPETRTFTRSHARTRRAGDENEAPV